MPPPQPTLSEAPPVVAHESIQFVLCFFFFVVGDVCVNPACSGCMRTRRTGGSVGCEAFAPWWGRGGLEYDVFRGHIRAVCDVSNLGHPTRLVRTLLYTAGYCSLVFCVEIGLVPVRWILSFDGCGFSSMGFIHNYRVDSRMSKRERVLTNVSGVALWCLPM